MRIHITSSGPRCGTTLLTELMINCFDIKIYANHEEPISKSYFPIDKYSFSLTKQPTISFGYNYLCNLNKSLRIICIIRDPRDMICSFHGRSLSKYYCDLSPWFNFTEKYYYVKDNQRILFINYEDLVNNPNIIQEKIQIFIPSLERKNIFSDYPFSNQSNFDILALKSRRPIANSSVGTWKDNLPRLKFLFEKSPKLSKSLVDYGYECNHEWLSVLNDVDAVDFSEYKKVKKFNKYMTFILAFLNMSLEKIGVNPNIVLGPFKKIF